MFQPTLVLASRSPFRRALLERLGIPFATAVSSVDEAGLPQERPEDLVLRLSAAKARAVAPSYPHALIIGSDQVACVDGAVLGKPGNRERAIEQLMRSSGRTVVFYTGLCLLHTQSGRIQCHCEPFRVRFRALTADRIAAYVDREQPFDCAGSFKAEGLGIALFERLEGEDPNALIGLPLIRLVAMLEAEGLDPLAPASADA